MHGQQSLLCIWLDTTRLCFNVDEHRTKYFCSYHTNYYVTCGGDTCLYLLSYIIRFVSGIQRKWFKKDNTVRQQTQSLHDFSSEHSVYSYAYNWYYERPSIKHCFAIMIYYHRRLIEWIYVIGKQFQYTNTHSCIYQWFYCCVQYA